MKVGIPATVERDCLIEAIRKITVDKDNFDIDEWEEYSGRVLIRAGAMILREHNESRRGNGVPAVISDDVAAALRAFFKTVTAEEFEKVKPSTFASKLRQVDNDR